MDPGITSKTARAKPRRRAGHENGGDGLINANHFYGTINCNGVNASGEVCGVTTTSGLAWKIPGRVGDSPILGAGLYVDGEVGAAGSTGRGEANLYNLSSYLIVEEMRRGQSERCGDGGPRRIKANTIEKRLLNTRGQPNFRSTSTSSIGAANTPASPCTTRTVRDGTPCVTPRGRGTSGSSRCSEGGATS